MAILLLVSLALTVCGFALLAMSQDQHRRAVGARPLAPRGRAAYRVPGHLLLIAALPIAIRSEGPGFGTLIWGCWLSIAALAVAFTLSWKPHWLSLLARSGRE